MRELTRAPSAESVDRGEAIAFHLGEPISPDALKGAKALVHCAYDFEARGWPEIEKRNVQGAAQLFEAAKAAGVEQIVCISTMSAFTGCKSLYGRAKLEIEVLASRGGALILRPGLIWGAGAGGMYGSLERQIAGGKILPLIGGDQILYLIYQEDLCRVIHRYCAKEFTAPAAPVTAAHDQPWTFRAILEEIARGAGKRVRFLPIPWRAVWLVLKTAETCGLRLNFRSDSLVSLMNQNAHPDFSQGSKIGFAPRPFRASEARS